MQALLQRKNNKNYIFRVSVCSRRYPACNAHAPCCYLWPVQLYKLFPHYLIKRTIFGRRLLNVKYVSIFSTKVSVKFLILRRNREIWSKLCVGVHVKYRLCLSYFNQTWMFSTCFRKILKYQLSSKSIHREPCCFMGTDGQTDMTKLIVAFSTFAKSAWKRSKAERTREKRNYT